MRYRTIIAAIALLICDGEQRISLGNSGDQKPAKSNELNNARKPALSLYDGFEGKSLAKFWRPGDHGSGRYAPGAVTLSDEYARSGKQSVRITVKEGDIEQIGGDDQQTERAELDSGKHPFVGHDVWYSFSFLVPKGFPVVDNRLVIAQWKQGGVDGGPLVAQRFRSGRHYLTVRAGKSRWFEKQYALPEITFGKWNDMMYHIVFASDQKGRVELWMNKNKVVSYQGPTTINGGEADIYNKFGLYRDRWKEPMTIFFDNYALGGDAAAVDPTRFNVAK